MPVPPDKLAAVLGRSDEEEDRGPFEKAIERACRAVVSAQRDCDDERVASVLQAIYSDLEDLVNSGGTRERV
jgi:hypothetical protein